MEWLERVFFYIMFEVYAYFDNMAYSMYVNFNVIMVATLFFIVGVFLNGLHDLVPDFFKKRYPSPAKYLSWSAVGFCCAGFYKVNIETGNMTLFSSMSNGYISQEVALIISLIPSSIWWLYQFEVIDRTRWKFLAYFAIGCDFILTMGGISISWELTTNSNLDQLVVSVLIVALCAVIGEMYVIDFLTKEYEKMQKRIKKGK